MSTDKKADKKLGDEKRDYYYGSFSAALFGLCLGSALVTWPLVTLTLLGTASALGAVVVAWTDPKNKRPRAEKTAKPAKPAPERLGKISKFGQNLGASFGKALRGSAKNADKTKTVDNPAPAAKR